MGRELGEPDGELSCTVMVELRGATKLSQHIKKNSKNPYKQSLVKEKRLRKFDPSEAKNDLILIKSTPETYMVRSGIKKSRF